MKGVLLGKTTEYKPKSKGATYNREFTVVCISFPKNGNPYSIFHKMIF